MTRLAFIEADIREGSGHKYLEQFRKLAEVDCYDLNENVDLSSYDGILVRGDRQQSYKKALMFNKPYILIEDDVHSLRSGKPEPNEKEMVENAAAVLFTADSHSSHCDRLYKIKYSEIIRLRPLLKDVKFSPLPKLGSKHCVYAGNYHGKKHAESAWSYRYNLPIFQKIIEAGYIVHLYPSHPRHEANREYRMIGCVTHERVPNEELYRELSQYSFGLQVFNNLEPQTALGKAGQHYGQTAEPNKAWEYLGAGIPTLGINGGLAPKYYEGKWGTNIFDTSPAAIRAAVDYIHTLELSKELIFSETIDTDLYKFQNLINKLTN